MNIKKSLAQKKIRDNKRIEDFMRSGGSGSMRNSLFSRKDETVTEDMVKTFQANLEQAGWKADVEGGDWGDNKQVIQIWMELPDKVPVGKVDALLSKVDYDKGERRFYALYRPKNGKWGQAEGTGKQLKK